MKEAAIVKVTLRGWKLMTWGKMPLKGKEAGYELGIRWYLKM